MKKTDFNRNWLVRRDEETKGCWVNLPHDAMITESRSKDTATTGAGGYFREGKYIYTKTFSAPKEWADSTVILEFEGVYMNSSLALNGEVLCERPYGYTNFFVNLTGKLKTDDVNTLTVIADNSKAPNSRWYSGSGIYREVQLYTGPKRSIAPEGVKVTVCGDDRILVKTEVFEGGETPAAGLPVRIEILEKQSGAVVVSANGLSGADIDLVIPDAKKWSVEEPNLYICRVSLDPENQDENLKENAEVTFGLRTISWGGKGLFINGEEVLLRGGCIHHDNGILGAACFADAEERRVRIMKECGFNAIRSAHNPMSKAMLDACDRLGMLVMDENFDMWLIHKNPYDYGKESFTKWWKADTKAMVDKDYNHPSVILYSLGNEISDLGLSEGQNLCKEMAEYVRSLDPERPLTMGINLMLASMAAKGKGLYGNGKEGEEDKGNGSQTMDSIPTSTFFNIMMNKMGDMMEISSALSSADKIVEKVSNNLDMPGYNYAGARYKKEAKNYPDRAFTGSETLPKKLYSNWKMVREIPNLTGDFMWTAWDYLGEAGIGTVRYSDKKTKKDIDENLIISGGPGVIDICGKARPETGWDKIIWGLQTEPTIGVDPLTHADHFKGLSMWRDTDAVESWSWKGCEGKKTDVVVYARDGYVSLAVNRKFYGKKKVVDGQAHFRNIPYENGYIGAISYDKDGNKLGIAKLVTSRGATRIKLTPERSELRANGQDLCFLNIDLAGINGVTKSACDQKLTVRVEGAGTLQAYGSARPNMGENFYSNTHTTYYGKSLAVIRAGYEAGEIKVTVSGEGLEPQTLLIQVR